MKTLTLITSLMMLAWTQLSQAEYRNANRVGRFTSQRDVATSTLSQNGANNYSTGFSSKSSGQRPEGGPGGFGGGPGGPGGRDGRGPRGPKLSAEQQAAFDSCMSGQGVAAPARPPEPTEAQRAQMQTCMQSSSGDPETMKSCMSAAGFSPPPRPTSDQMAALKACRSQVVGSN